MEGARLRDLKTALKNLTGIDTSLTGQFARFRDRERITMIPFNHKVPDVRDFDIDLGRQESMQQIRDYVDVLRADGGTAIFSALRVAYDLAAQAQRQDPGRYYSIVLMSDGENRDGITQARFLSHYRSLSKDAQGIKTFTILFGQSEKETMEAVAEATGGRAFDAKSESLSFVFKKIRGYQ
jgi:Ca-activated chloride channel family protein